MPKTVTFDPTTHALVPLAPTDDMVQAGWIDKEDVSPAEIYRAMVAARPFPFDEQPARPTAAQVMTEQFHRSGLPAEIEVEEVAPEGVEPVKVVRP